MADHFPAGGIPTQRTPAEQETRSTTGAHEGPTVAFPVLVSRVASPPAEAEAAKPHPRPHASPVDPSLIAAATRLTTLTVPVLPAPPAAPLSARERRRAERLPSDERGMLIFVSVLIALGTLAIVAMAGFGR